MRRGREGWNREKERGKEKGWKKGGRVGGGGKVRVG